MKNQGVEDDQVYDWMTLRDGKGWEAVGVSLATGRQMPMLTPHQSNAAQQPDASRQSRTRGEKEYRDRVDRLRNGGSAGGVPSPMCVYARQPRGRARADSSRKQRKSGQGSALPNASNQAIVGVSAPSPLPGSRRQSQHGAASHPFASANAVHGDREAYDESNAAIPSQAGMPPIAPMTVNGRGGNTAANSQQPERGGEGDYAPQKKGGFLSMLMCGCCR